MRDKKQSQFRRDWAGRKRLRALTDLVERQSPSVAPPPPPLPAKVAEAPKPAPPEVIRLGGDVEAARVISAPNPVYPLIAREGRIQGTVELEAIIGRDRHVENFTAVKGNSLSIGAAMNAVKHWVYRPTGTPSKWTPRSTSTSNWLPPYRAVNGSTR